MEVLNRHLPADLAAKQRYQARLADFNAKVNQQTSLQQRVRLNLINTSLAIVIHILLPDPTVVTHEQINQQLQILNATFNGTRSDAANIPSYFVGVLGGTGVQFCLA